MPAIMTPKVTDALAYVLTVGLAAGCIAFAGYKVMKLRSMDNPPADMGLNFPPPKRKMITDDAVEVDPLTTQSTAPAAAVRASGQQVVQPYVAEAPIQDYRLLTVIDGIAFVEVLTLRGKEIRPISVGTRLPGAGPVDRIDRINGRWTLIAGDVKLVAER